VSVRSSVVLLLLAAALAAHSAGAAEGGSGLYLPGFSGPQAGLQPPPGWYLQSHAVFYDASSDDLLPFSNRIAQDVDATMFGAIFIPTWVSEYRILGGNVGLAVAVPILRLDLEVGLLSDRATRLSGNLLTAQQRFDDLSARLESANTALLGASQTLARRANQLAAASDRLATFFPNASTKAAELSAGARQLSTRAAELAAKAERGAVVLAEAADAAGQLSDVAQRLAFVDLSDHDANVGDLAITPMIGWHAGNFHWLVAPSIFAPTGHYDPDDIANVGKNHWALDLSAGLTWIQPKYGQEVSIFAGYTINWENHSTDYDTGDEFHLEIALIQHLPKGFEVGFVGYYYDQVTADRGPATAFLGGFQGRVYGYGPILGWIFELGGKQAGISARWYHESGAENRLEGDTGFVTFSLEL
jgi:hypothetical protein